MKYTISKFSRIAIVKKSLFYSVWKGLNEVTFTKLTLRMEDKYYEPDPIGIYKSKHFRKLNDFFQDSNVHLTLDPYFN